MDKRSPIVNPPRWDTAPGRDATRASRLSDSNLAGSLRLEGEAPRDTWPCLTSQVQQIVKCSMGPGAHVACQLLEPSI